MREMIGESQKTTMLYMVIMLGLCMIASLRVLGIFPSLGLFALILLGGATIFGLVAFFRMPKSSICREGDTLLLCSVWRRCVVQIADVQAVKITPQGNTETASLKFTIRTETGSRAFTVVVTNKTVALQKLKALIPQLA